MKIKNVFNEFMENDNFDESAIYKNNEKFFDKMNVEIGKIYVNNLLHFWDIILLDCDGECIRDNLTDLINDNMNVIVNDISILYEKYKNIELQ